MLKGGSSYFCNLARGHGASQSEKNHHWKEKEEEEERKEGEDKGKKREREEAFFAKALMLLQREYIAFLLRALSTAFRPTFSKLRPARNIIRKPCCITFRVSRCFLFRQIKIKLAIITYRFLAQNDSFFTKPRDHVTLFLAERTRGGYATR